MIVDIKDIHGNIRFSTPINKGSKRKLLLMKEDYITLKFSLDKPVYFHLGDGIDNELGMYELVDLYKPEYNAETSGYDYDLRLDAYYWKWKNKKFFYTPENGGREAGWNLTATLDVHLNIFVNNLKALGYKFRDKEFEWKIDNSVKSVSKFVSYDNVNLIDALTQMAETWECEWWITENYIKFGRCEFSSPVDFKVADLEDTENVNVNSMQRSDSQTTYATRIYAFGSTRNIPSVYRKSLVFDVKNIKGTKISDTSRVLNIQYFPSESYLLQKKDIYHSSVKNNPEAIEKKLEYSVSITLNNNVVLKAGNYRVKIEELKMACSANSSKVNTFTNRATLVFGQDSTVLVDEVQRTVNFHQFKIVDREFEVNVSRNSFTCELRLYSSIEKCLLNGNIDYYVKGTFENVVNGASTSITFVSGSYKGKTFASTYNPEFLTGDDANVIQLPSGIYPATGDRYTINNIIKGKVPDNYFSKSDDNLTLSGVIQKRLLLPDGIPYLDAYRYSPTGERLDITNPQYNNPENVEMPEEEALEEVVVFDDVYPKYDGTVSVVFPPEYVDKEENGGGKAVKKYPVYTFKDTGLKKFNDDFRLEGEELHLIFQTGKLAGLDFVLQIKESDDTGTTFKIKSNEDYGRYLPDEVLFPQAVHMEDDKEVAADTYILYGFDTAYISEDMLPNAEIELKNRAIEYVAKTQTDPSTYSCNMDSQYIYNEGKPRTFEIGDRVNLINKTFFENGRQSRIIGYEASLDIPYDHPVYVVGETAPYSRLGAIESKVNSLTYNGKSYGGGSTSGGGGIGVYLIGVNDKTLPSDRNVFSSKKALDTFLNKTEPDTAIGHVTFENGILVRKQEIIETSTMALIEEDDAIIEELAIKSDLATLGEISNVSKEVDESSETNDLMIRVAGASEWTVNSTLVSEVSQLMDKVFPFTMSLTGGGMYEKGSIQTINLSWNYDREITSQSINEKMLPIDVRRIQYADIDADTTYTLSVQCSGQTFKKSVAAVFRLKKYYGTSDKESLTNEEILALSTLWAERGQSATVFNCLGGKFAYYILPQSMASGIQFWVGGLRNSDWVEEVRDLTNAYGHTEKYIIFRLNSIQTGVLNIEVK